LTPDTCEVEGRHFFVKGNLWIPVQDEDQYFKWMVWVSLGEKDYERFLDLWDFAGRETEPPYTGSMASEIWQYPQSMNLNVQVMTMPVGELPAIQLEPADHPLVIAQRNGITMAWVQEIAELVLHQNDGGVGTPKEAA
jgi:hypothetical protein